MTSRKTTKTGRTPCAPPSWRGQHTLQFPRSLFCWGTEPMCQQSGGQTSDGKKSNAFAADIALPVGFTGRPRVCAVFHSPKNLQAPALALYEITLQPDLTRCALWATTGGPQVADDYVCAYSIVGVRKKKSVASRTRSATPTRKHK